MATVPSIGRAEPGLRLVPDAGDATRDLYERYGAQIFRFCLRELGNREEAEDAAQTTFLNAFRGLERGVAPEFESAWLHTIAHRVCVSRKRSAWRRGRVEAPTDLDAIQEAVPSHSPDRGHELFGLRDALEGLPEQQRRALLLREWQGLSCHEIAVELGLSASAVEMLLFRARRGVVRDLTAETPAPPRRGLRSRLRTSGDLGSIIAAVKTLFFTGGTKVIATLATVAASSVVAATPATRHEIADLVALPDAPHAVTATKPAPVRTAAAARTHVVTAAAPQAARPARAETKTHVTRAHAKVRPHARSVGGRRFGVSTPPTVTPHAPTPVATPVATPAATAPPATAPSTPDGSATPPDASAAPPAAAAQDPAPATTPDPQPVAPAAPAPAVTPQPQQRAAVTTTTTPAPPVLPPAASVASFSPAGGRAGDTVKITGAHLSGATSVSFNGVSAQFKVDGDAQIKATVPAGATSGPISVTGPGGTATSAASFTVAAPPAPPVVTVVHTPIGVVTGQPGAPSKPPVVVAPPPPPPSVGGVAPAGAAPGASVTISGSAFTGTSSVSFNGVPTTFTVTSDTQIVARVPDAATTGLVTVTTPNGTATSVASFTVAAPAPSVSTFAPAGGLAGASVTISGSHLTGATAVTFNGVAASFVVVSDTQLTAQVPAGATSGAIAVTTPGGTSAAGGFAVLAAPDTSGFSPPAGPPGIVARGKK